MTTAHLRLHGEMLHDISDGVECLFGGVSVSYVMPNVFYTTFHVSVFSKEVVTSF